MCMSVCVCVYVCVCARARVCMSTKTLLFASILTYTKAKKVSLIMQAHLLLAGTKRGSVCHLLLFGVLSGRVEAHLVSKHNL